MPRKQSIKTKRYKFIYHLVREGYSANKIQTELRVSVYGGVRRKILLAEIRSIKGVSEPTKEKIEKSIPTKYRKKGVGVGIGLGIGEIYRGSLIISSVPLHSTPFNRHYLGFRFNVFSYNKNDVYDTLRSMKKEFIRMVANKLGNNLYAQEQTLGLESPTLINVLNSNRLNGKWFFAVEEKGKDIDSESGYI